MKGEMPTQTEFGHSFLPPANQLLLINVGLTLILAANNPERPSVGPHICMQTAFLLFLLLEYAK